ncbi:MAG: BrnT family toxin [Deltaproteobacteria bacterium]|nr:BrnT family toxin [Deltaproteobacteria bacterium]
MRFEWDDEKRLANVEKHGVDFNDAPKLFTGPFLTLEDARQDYGEQRFIAFGHVDNRLMVIAFTKRNGVVRIISMRKANECE